MNEIMVYDAYGDSISNLVQWDSNVKIYIDESEITKNYKIHFFNKESVDAYVVESSYSNNILCAKIPDILLTKSHTIIGYVYTDADEEHKSIFCFKIPVRKRPKPMNFIFVDSKDYTTLESILDECKKYANNASDYADASNASAIQSKSYAVGGTSTRINEDKDNSKYYCDQSQANAYEASKSAKSADKSNVDAQKSASAASQSESNASNSAIQAKSYADQIEKDKQEIDKVINESLLASSEDILKRMEDYFNRAEALYRSCSIFCDGEVPQRRVRTIVKIDCHTPQRRATNYKGIEFDGGTPGIRLLGE